MTTQAAGLDQREIQRRLEALVRQKGFSERETSARKGHTLAFFALHPSKGSLLSNRFISFDQDFIEAGSTIYSFVPNRDSLGVFCARVLGNSDGLSAAHVNGYFATDSGPQSRLNKLRRLREAVVDGNTWYAKPDRLVQILSEGFVPVQPSGKIPVANNIATYAALADVRTYPGLLPEGVPANVAHTLAYLVDVAEAVQPGFVKTHGLEDAVRDALTQHGVALPASVFPPAPAAPATDTAAARIGPRSGGRPEPTGDVANRLRATLADLGIAQSPGGRRPQ